MNRTLRYLWISSLVLIALLFGMGIGVLFDRAVVAQAPSPAASPNGSRFSLLDEVWAVIDDHYVDRDAIEEQRLLYAAASGLVEALGDTGHTVFLTPEMVAQERSYRRGVLEGIGAELQVRDGQIVVVAPIDDSPAQRAGLQPGDTILAVDGEPVSGKPLSEVVPLILGPAGTEVTLLIQSARSEESRELTITRARININVVTWTILPGTDVAYVRLAGFSERSSTELERALREARAQGAGSLVLDLRNNPGGLLEQCIRIASQFLRSGTVVQQRDANGDVEIMPVRNNVPKTDLPMVVLINGGSASASEIVAGALQAENRAPLVGQTTFGTGTVLNQFHLSDGSAIMLAIAEWLTPDGRTIWHEGIEPDHVVALPEDQLPMSPRAASELSPEELFASEDLQLLRALELLGHTPPAPRLQES
jgi:carboxyl-terminal processing protease